MTHASHLSFSTVTEADPAACFLGESNGTWPNGTAGSGTFSRFGFYNPTQLEKGLCQNANDPWVLSPRYGYYTVYFILATFILASVINAITRHDNLARSRNVPSAIALPSRLSTTWRALAYRRLSPFLPPIGSCILIASFSVFSLVIVFAPRPYYWPRNFGTTPLGLRSEWVATVVLPFIVAAGVKVNAVSYLSGTTMHGLMVLHKTVPWISLFFSVIHTWTMIIRARRQGWSWAYTIANSKVYYLYGIPPLVCLAFLCVASLGPVRRACHQAFYWLHIVAVIIMTGFMFLHCDRLLGSWSYLYALVGIWGASIVMRMIKTLNFQTWFLSPLPRASLELLPSNAIRITIPVSAARIWSPGSHVYLRFPTVRPWENHPFTIASIPTRAPLSNDGSSIEKTDHDSVPQNELVFVIRPHAGITARLRRIAEKGLVSLPVIVDGPFVGDPGLENSLFACDSALFIAGGTGASCIAPMFESLLRARIDGEAACRQVSLVVAVREADAMHWFPVLARRHTDVTTKFHITGKGEPLLDRISHDSGAEKPLEGAQLVDFDAGRPDVRATISKAAAQCHGRLAVFSCGPEGHAVRSPQ